MSRQTLLTIGLLALAAPGGYAKPKPAYILQTIPVRKVEATYTYEVRYPNLDAQVWELVVAMARNLPGQSVAKVVTEPAGDVIYDGSDLKQPMLRVLVRPKTDAQKKTVKLVVRTEVTLMARRLVPFRTGMKVPVVTAPAGQERQAALAATPRLDHDHEAFQKWLDRYKLRRRKNESDVLFALRVFATMKQTMTYKRPFGHDGKASSTCQAGRGDCGCLSTVFVCALRANGIPARELVGRLVKSGKPFEKSEYGVHARAEFFADKIGWVPADPSFGLGDRSPLGLNHFGNDAGDLLVLHLDGDLVVERQLAGKATLVRLQGVACWATGRGNFEKPERKEDWQVRDLPLKPKKK
jgi:transglutaminase-like putative cysteine protease